MKTAIITTLLVVASLHCCGDPALGEAPVVLGQPSIFWHNGQWQTYNDGVWTPYGKPVSDRLAQPPGKQDAAHSGPGIRDVGVARRAALRKSASLRRGPNSGIGKTTIGVGKANAIGQSANGFGEPNLGIGRSTIGIGQPSAGIGRPNGIGQTTIGIGKPNVGIGPSTIGIGQPNRGIGQPNAIGQTTIGIGKPASFPSQQRSPDTAR